MTVRKENKSNQLGISETINIKLDTTHFIIQISKLRAINLPPIHGVLKCQEKKSLFKNLPMTP